MLLTTGCSVQANNISDTKLGTTITESHTIVNLTKITKNATIELNTTMYQDNNKVMWD